MMLRRMIPAQYRRFTRMAVYEYDLRTPIASHPSGMDVSFRFAEPADIEAMDTGRYGYGPERKQYARMRMQCGDRCVLALDHSRIVGYMWIMNGEMELSQIRHIRIPKSKAYIYNGFVVDSHRGKKVLHSLYRYMADLLRSEGKETFFICIATKHMISMKAHKMIDIRRIGVLFQIRFFGLSYDYIPRKVLAYITR